MSGARKFLNLPADDRLLLVEAVALVVVVRLGLWLLPFQTLRRLLVRLPARVAGAPDDDTLTRRIAWAVPVVSSYIPAATCLTQALAAQALCARRGCATQLRIGVARGIGGRLEAHAWLERDGQVLVGGSAHERYAPLM